MAGTKNPVTFNEPRMLEAFESAIAAWQSGILGLDGKVPPEIELLNRFSDVDLTEQANVLFSFGRINLSGEKADALRDQLTSLIHEHPWIIRPNEYQPYEHTIEDVFNRMIRFTAMRPQLHEWWRLGLERLRRDYGGDPREIFYRSDGTRRGLIQELSKFKGIGHKIANLNLGFFHRWAKVHDPSLHAFFEDVDDHFLAIDVWWLRQIYQWGLVADFQTDNREVIGPFIADYICRFSKRHNLNYWVLGQSVWNIGSKICNRVHAGRNNMRTAYWCWRHCPMNNICLYIVRPDKKGTSRGESGWTLAQERVRINRPQVHQHVLIEFNGHLKEDIRR